MSDIQTSTQAEEPKLPRLLRDYRAQHGLTIVDAGALVDGSHAVWSTWEAGAVPTPGYLHRLGELLGLSESEIRAAAGPDRVRRSRSVGDAESCALARWRFAAGLSASELARKMHVSLSLISRWESGERTPARRYWNDLAAALHVTPDDIADTIGESRAPSDRECVTALRDIRIDRGLTQIEIAKLLGVDVTSIQRWESLGSAPHAQAVALAELFATDLESLSAPAAPRQRRSKRPMPLRRLREQRHLPTRVVAARIGVSPSALLAWERGDTQPSWLHARLLARTINVSVSEVFAAAGLTPPRLLVTATRDSELTGEALRELRRWNGSRQADIGRAVGVATSTVAAWEQGRQRPGRAAARRLRDVVSAAH